MPRLPDLFRKNWGQIITQYNTLHHLGQFDLTITDMTMPQMTGDTLVKEILKIRPDMPIILSTGYSEKINRESAVDIGARKYVEKPLDKRELATAIRDVLDEK